MIVAQNSHSRLIKLFRITEYAFVILGLTFFSGAFGVFSLGLVLPPSVVTFVRFLIWLGSTALVFVFWKQTIITIKNNLLLFILITLAFFSFIWSVSPEYTLFNAREVWMTATFALYFSIRFSLKEQMEAVATTLFIGIILSIFSSLFIPQVGRHIADEHSGLWKGIYGHKNALGALMTFSTLTFSCLQRSIGKIYKYGGFILSLALVILSGSRTSFVVFFLITAVLFLYKRFRWRGKVSVIFLDFGILLFGSLFTVILSYWVEILTGLGRDPSLTGRLPIWNSMIERLMERPLLGFGRGAFFAPQSPYAVEAGQFMGTGWIPPHGHNGLLDLAIDLGLIGVSIFLVIYLQTFFKVLTRAYVSQNAENNWALAFIIFLTMNNITESLLLYQYNIYWVLFMTIALGINQKRITIDT